MSVRPLLSLVRRAVTNQAGFEELQRSGSGGRHSDHESSDHLDYDDEAQSASELEGGYDPELFVGDPKELKEFECPICCNVMRDATETDCGHLFCKSCIVSWLRIKNRCPICKERPKGIGKSFYFRQKITRLKTRCHCGQMLPLKDLAVHQEECRNAKFETLARQMMKDRKQMESRIQHLEKRMVEHEEVLLLLLVVGAVGAIYHFWKNGAFTRAPAAAAAPSTPSPSPPSNPAGAAAASAAVNHDVLQSRNGSK